jgi:uncharacterized protein
MYEAVDQGWLQQPKMMSSAVLTQALRRIVEHVGSSAEPVDLVLHGGEPLLVGPAGMRTMLERIHDGLRPLSAFTVTVQTNGVRLDQAFAELFLEFGVRVGISLDGGRAATDRHRRFANGRSSFPLVQRAAELMSGPPFRPSFAGLLCTIDVANSPSETFDELLAFNPPRIDFLLPHATWDSPPAAARQGTTPYADWLIEIFDRWYADPDLVGIRLFEELMHALLGGVSRSEAIGFSAPASVVIETDGSIEQTDALKITFPGAAATGFSVLAHSLDEMLQDPATAAASFGNELSAICRSCPVLAGCGGGLYPHRYRSANGFDNPSVYCHELERLVRYIDGRIRADLPFARPKELIS